LFLTHSAKQVDNQIKSIKSSDVMEVAGILKKRPMLADIATNDFLPR
jgi:hypothetical protein